MVDAPWEENGSYPGAQVSFFLGTERSAPQLVVRAATAGQLDKLLAEFEETDPEGLSVINSIFDRMAAIDAAAKLKLNLGKPAQTGDGFTPSGAKPWGEQSAQGQPETCKHGPMKWKSGTSQNNGKPYQGWVCTSMNRADQCPPKWKN